MTATPIPRTVAMTVFGDLDVSTLDEVPAGRAEVTTHVINPRTQPRHVDRLWERAAEEAAAGHRVFIVCPRIDAANVEEGSTAAMAGETDVSIATVEETVHEAVARLPNASGGCPARAHVRRGQGVRDGRCGLRRSRCRGVHHRHRGRRRCSRRHHDDRVRCRPIRYLAVASTSRSYRSRQSAGRLSRS